MCELTILPSTQLAFFKLSKETHPDVAPKQGVIDEAISGSNEDRFKRISEAYGYVFFRNNHIFCAGCCLGREGYVGYDFVIIICILNYWMEYFNPSFMLNTAAANVRFVVDSPKLHHYYSAKI